MNVEDILKMADELVFAKTGQHLDNLQEAILRKTIEGYKYTQIAKEVHCNESYVRDVGSKLWQILSEELGEEVNKVNLRSTMGRFYISNVSNFAQDVVAISSFNTCKNDKHSTKSSQLDESIFNSESRRLFYENLSEMPELEIFYDRTVELKTLTDWIIEQQCRLVSITGISGIGKTTLIVQLVQQIKDEFDYVIWFNLSPSSTFTEFQEQLIQFFNQADTEDSIYLLKPLSAIKYLQKYRCLIILDDIHNLFSSGELAGKYQKEHEEYRSFFKQIKKLAHQSCILLIGWEQPTEIALVIKPDSHTRTLRLTGLETNAAMEIFKEYGLAEIENAETLIDQYQGNPFWLKSVATLIQELGEDIIKLLPDGIVLLPEEMKVALKQQCDRLSPAEKQILTVLAKENQPISLAQLITINLIPMPELPNALQSLLRRCLIEKQENRYFLPSILKQYIGEYRE